jgi:hypothetical protein
MGGLVHFLAPLASSTFVVVRTHAGGALVVVVARRIRGRLLNSYVASMQASSAPPPAASPDTFLDVSYLLALFEYRALCATVESADRLRAGTVRRRRRPVYDEGWLMILCCSRVYVQPASTRTRVLTAWPRALPQLPRAAGLTPRRRRGMRNR